MLAGPGPASAAQTEAVAIADSLAKSDPQSALFATYLEQALEIGGDIATDQKQASVAAPQYRRGIAVLEPFMDGALSDTQIATEVAESKWKLAQVVTGAERATLRRDALAVMERLQRAKRLSPDRQKLLERMKRG